MFQMKGQDKIQTKKNDQINGDRQPSRKRIQNNDSEDDPGSQKQNGENARNVYQRHKKKQLKNKQRLTVPEKESIAE